MSPDEQMERVRMALAEAGYGDVEIEWNDAFDMVSFVEGHRKLPLYVAWKAATLTGTNDQLCWPCCAAIGWQDADIPKSQAMHHECDHDVDPFCREDAVAA